MDNYYSQLVFIIVFMFIKKKEKNSSLESKMSCFSDLAKNNFLPMKMWLLSLY